MQFLKNTDPRFHLVETRARFFIFIAVAGLVGLAAFVIWKQEIFRSSRRIDLMATSSQGIQRGMAARLSGFRIGKVGDVELEGENRVRVNLEVFSEYAHFLRGNSVATIASESLIGDRFIDITAGSANAPELKDGDTLPLSPEKSIGTLVESLKDEIRPAVVETREIISFLNDPKGDFKLTLASLRIVSESLKSDVPKIMQDTQKAAQQGTELFTSSTNATPTCGSPLKISTSSPAPWPGIFLLCLPGSTRASQRSNSRLRARIKCCSTRTPPSPKSTWPSRRRPLRFPGSCARGPTRYATRTR
jgi:ABC-type transporter Mla subunit MlaD